MRFCDYCQNSIDNFCLRSAAFKSALSFFELGKHVFCDEDCAAKHIAQLEAENAQLRASLAAAEVANEADARIAELEAENARLKANQDDAKRWLAMAGVETSHGGFGESYCSVPVCMMAEEVIRKHVNPKCSICGTKLSDHSGLDCGEFIYI